MDLNSNNNVILKINLLITIQFHISLSQTCTSKWVTSTFTSFAISVAALATDVYLFVIAFSSSLILPNSSLRCVSNRSSIDESFLVDSY